MIYLKKFNESNLEDDFIMIFSNQNHDFKIKLLNDAEEYIEIGRYDNKRFNWSEISDRVTMFSEHIRDEYKGYKLSYLTEFMIASSIEHFWCTDEPFPDVWDIYTNGDYIKMSVVDIEIITMEIYIEVD